MALIDKIKMKYAQDELDVICKLCWAASSKLLESKDMDNNLLAVLLGKISIKAQERLVKQQDTYEFSFQPEQALAFYKAYDSGVIATTNVWTQQVLNQTFEQINRAYQL